MPQLRLEFSNEIFFIYLQDLFEKPDAIDQEIADFAAPNAVNDPTDRIQKAQGAVVIVLMLYFEILINNTIITQ